MASVESILERYTLCHRRTILCDPRWITPNV